MGSLVDPSMSHAAIAPVAVPIARYRALDPGMSEAEDNPCPSGDPTGEDVFELLDIPKRGSSLAESNARSELSVAAVVICSPRKGPHMKLDCDHSDLNTVS